MKKFTIKVISIVLSAIFIVCAYNYHFDRYGIYNKDFSTLRVEPNQHIVKMQYLLDNPSKYNALCFGSSRVGRVFK